MTTWFDGASEIRCTLDEVRQATDDAGHHFLAAVGRMPGMTQVELVEPGPDPVVIRTNEGLMTRSGIHRTDEADRLVVEYDERYQAGSVTTGTSHLRHEFTPSGTGVTHHLVISDVEATGPLGFLYRTFGSRRMGRAFLDSYEKWLAPAD